MSSPVFITVEGGACDSRIWTARLGNIRHMEVGKSIIRYPSPDSAYEIPYILHQSQVSLVMYCDGINILQITKILPPLP
jgi:hypothetical protein